METNFLKALGKAGGAYTKVVEVLLYAVAVLVPLFYLPLGTGVLEYNKQMLLVGAMAVALVVWLLGVVVSGKLTVRGSVLDKGIFAIVLATIVATIFSVARTNSVFGMSGSAGSALITVLALAVFHFLTLNTIHDRGRLMRRLLGLGVAVALVVGVAQMFTLYVLPGGMTHSRAFNTLGSLNTLGIVAAIFLAFFAKSTGRAAGLFDTIVSSVGIVSGLVILCILNWWVLWAVALTGMLAMIAFDSLNATQLAQDYAGKQGRFALSRFLIPVTVVVLGAVLLLVKFNLSSVRSQFPLEVAPSHAVSVRVARGVLFEKLFYGYGPENFNLAFDRYGAKGLADTQFTNLRFYDGSSEAMTTLVHTGAFGLLAFLLLGWCIVQVIARFSTSISDSIARGQSATFAIQSSGLLAAVLAMIVASLLYPFSMAMMFVAMALMTCAALVVSGDRVATVDIEERPMYSLFVSLGFIVALIAVLTGMYFASMAYAADMAYARALQHSKTATELATGLNGAIDMNGNDDRMLRDASGAQLGILRDLVAQQGKKDAPADLATRTQSTLAAAVQLAQRATVVAPLESLNWSNLGDVYQSLVGLVDNVEQLAQQAYDKASSLRPGDPTFDNKAGVMWMGKADLIRQLMARSGGNTAKLKAQADDALEQARENFVHAIDKSPTFGLAIYNLGSVYDRQGMVTEAISQLEKILPYNPNEPTLMFELGMLYIRAGAKDNALAAMQRAVLLAPKYANARWYLALLLEERGQIDDALVQLNAIKEDNPDNAALQQKIDQLEAGKRSIPPAKVIDSKPIR